MHCNQDLLIELNKLNLLHVVLLPIVLDYDAASFQVTLAHSYRKGINGFKQDHKEAFRYFESASKCGNLEAEAWVAHPVFRARAEVYEDDENYRLAKLNIEKGYPLSYLNLCCCFLEGTGVEKNVNEAIELFKKGANLEDSWCQMAMAYLYEKGEVLDKNLIESIRFYRLSVEQENEEAQYYLGCSYEIGEGVDQDYKEAFRLIKLSADQGVELAQFKLGEFYENGKGIEKNLKEAIRFYQYALDQGSSGAKEGLKRCEILLAPN